MKTYEQFINDNKLTLYHGTSLKYLDDIKKNGLISKVGYDTNGWYMMSTDFESALFHALPTNKTDIIVVEFTIPIKENDYWIGYPYLWKGGKRTDSSTWYALMKPIPKKFIKKIHYVDYDKWLEQKNKGF
jgi:hypothetical protein